MSDDAGSVLCEGLRAPRVGLGVDTTIKIMRSVCVYSPENRRLFMLRIKAVIGFTVFYENTHIHCAFLLYACQVFCAEGDDAAVVIDVEAAPAEPFDIQIVRILKGHGGDGEAVCRDPGEERIEVRHVGTAALFRFSFQFEISLPAARNEIAVAQRLRIRRLRTTAALGRRLGFAAGVGGGFRRRAATF